jgi:hypothetical protein
VNPIDYLARAKALMKKQTVRTGALVLLPLATIVAGPEAKAASPLQIDYSSARFPSGGSFTIQPTIFASETINGAKFAGSATITGHEWLFEGGRDSPFTFSMGGVVRDDVGISAGSSLTLSYNFQIFADGGPVSYQVLNYLATGDVVEQRSNDTGELPAVTNGVYNSYSGLLSSAPFASDHHSGQASSSWNTVLNIFWTPSSPDEPISIYISENSVDTITNVPEASTVWTMALCSGTIGLGLYRRLRKRSW